MPVDNFDPAAYAASLQAQATTVPPENIDPAAYVASLKAQQPSQNQPGQPGQLESFIRGTAQGATMGFADELTAGAEGLLNPRGLPADQRFATPLAESRANYAAAQQANPKTYMGGEIVGGLASAAIPVAGPASLAGKIGLGAAQGAAAGLGYSEDKASPEGIKSALTGAAIGGAIPGVLGVAGKLLPGVKGSIVNSPIAGGSRLFGASEESAKTYKNMLQNPELFEAARAGKSAVLDNVDEFYKPLAQETIATIKSAVGKEYQTGAETAGTRLAAEPDALAKLTKLDENIRANIIGKANEEIKANPGFYKGKAREVIDNVKDVINNEYPGALKSETTEAINAVNKRITQLAKTGYAGKASLALEQQKLADLTRVNAMSQVQKMLDARRTLDQAINYKGLDWKPSDYQQRLFSDMRGKLDDILKTNPEIAKVDKMYSEYANSFKPLSKMLTSAETRDVEVNKVINFLKGGSGDATQAFNTQALEKTNSFINNTFKDNKEVINQWQKFYDNARPFKLWQSLNGLKQTTGEFTGRSWLPFGVTEAVTHGAGAMLGAGPGAAIATATAPWTLALMSPVKYLEALRAVRGGIKSVDNIFGQGAVSAVPKTIMQPVINNKAGETNEPE